MRTDRAWIAVVLVALLLVGRGAAAVAAPAPLWGPNLMPNPSLEEVDDQGRGAGWVLAHHGAKAGTLGVSDDACAGRRCLLMEYHAEEGQPVEQISNQAFGPLVPTEEGWYVVLFWMRADYPEGAQPEGPAMVYLRHRGGPDNQQDAGPPVYFYFGSMADIAGRWRYAFALVHQRPGQTALQMQVPQGGQYRLRVDAVQVRRLLVPEVKQPLNVNEIRDSYYGGASVRDPQASTGLAWKVTEGLFPAGSKIMGPERSSELPGLYRATYRFKQQVAGKQSLLLTLSGGGGQTLEDVMPGDFAANDKYQGTGYQDFPVYFLYPFGSGSFYSWAWRGEGTYFFDRLKLERLQGLTYREAWDLLYEGVDPDKVLPKPAVAADPPATAQPRAWLAYGLYTDTAKVEQALAGAGVETSVSHITPQRQLTPPFPDLAGYRLAVLADVPARLVDPTGQYLLMRWVNQGGGLVVLGGPLGYGYGGTPGSFIGNLLPVDNDQTFNLYRLDQPAPVLRPNGEKLGNALWLHRATPRDQAKVLLTAGGQPFAVGWQYGEGKVLALLGPPLGEPEQPSWESPAWVGELTNLMKWTVGI